MNTFFKRFIFIALSFISITAISQNDYYLFIGTYTSGKSEGIYVYKFDTTTAKNSLASIVKTSNPSYLAISTLTNLVYAVNENKKDNENPDGGSISSYTFNKKTASLTFVDKKSSGGDHPCYISVDQSGRWLFTGNYTSGTVAVSPAMRNGMMGVPSQISQHYGTGTNPQRQEAPHVHGTFLSPDEKFLLVPDLGVDKVFIYPVDLKNGTIAPSMPAYISPFPGAGPRHLDFHPSKSIIYILEELTGYVSVCAYKNGMINPIERVNAHPLDYKGAIGSADIHVSPDGKYLYASHRGDINNISIFKIDEKTGKIALIGFQSTLGKTPRNFTIDPSGKFLLVANQNSDEIVIFSIDKNTGLLTDTKKRISIPNPVCMKWLSVK